jgi:hypothetical protein
VAAFASDTLTGITGITGITGDAMLNSKRANGCEV